jgi:hypothetical protein
MISNLASALTMTAVSASTNPQNKAVLGVISSDTSLCGGEAHLRVKKISAHIDRTEEVIGAASDATNGIL